MRELKRIGVLIAVVLGFFYIVGKMTPDRPQVSRVDEIREGCNREFDTLEQQRACFVEINLRERAAEHRAAMERAAR